MPGFKISLLAVALLLVPLYPKFPLLGVSGTYVAVRLEDFVILTVFLIFLASNLRDKFRVFFTPVSRSILLYLFIGFVSLFSGIFLTKTTTLNLGMLHAFRRVEYFALFFAAYSFLKNIQQLKFLIRIILLSSLLVALYGLGQQFLGLPVISTTNSEFAKGLALTLGAGARINSTFAGHYDLAAYSVFPLLLIIALLPVSRHKLSLLVIGGLIYWTMLLSASRITFASLLISSLSLVVLIRRKIWIIPVLLLAFLGVLVSPQLRGRYLEFITNHLSISVVSPVRAEEENKDVNQVPDALKAPAQPEDRSFNIRLQAEWPRALRAAAKNPVLGTGFSSVGLAVDNDYFRALAETGIFGLLAFMLIFLRIFKTTLPLVLRYNPGLGNSFILAVSCFMFSMMLNALFIDIFAASKIAIISWLVTGLAEKTKSINV